MMPWSNIRIAMTVNAWNIGWIQCSGLQKNLGICQNPVLWNLWGSKMGNPQGSEQGNLQVSKQEKLGCFAGPLSCKSTRDPACCLLTLDNGWAPTKEEL